jgi:CheY-like chemotaxis protein
MSRVFLFHWNAAEAAERAEGLRRAGHDVEAYSDQRGQKPHDLRDDPPDAVVIDLGHAPTLGRDVALSLRQRKATRRVPLVIVGGEPGKVERLRELLPDATFAEWKGVRGALRDAMRSPPEKPVSPGALAGYSGTPLPRKLGIKPGSVVALLGAPERFEETLGTLPEGATLRRDGRAATRLALLFTKTRSDLARRFDGATRAVADGGSLWIVWPKMTSPLAKDLNETGVRAFGLDQGWVDYKVCAVDQDWSGLLFTRRWK